MFFHTRENKDGGEKEMTGHLRLYPAAAGLAWLVAVVALALVAINYGNNLIFALTALALALWLNAGWECWRNAQGAIWQAAPVAPAFAGEKLRLSGSVRAETGRTRRGFMLLAAGEPIPGTPGDAGTTLEVAIPAGSRGKKHLAGTRLVSRWPLGFWRASRLLPPCAALVWPRPEGDLPLPESAPVPACQRQGVDDFEGLRAYAPGDAPRRVNWRVYGRSGELAVNVFAGEAGGTALRLDFAACAGDVEARLAQLARWVLEAERQGRPYTLALPGTAETAPGHGASRQAECLARLAVFGKETKETP